MRLLFSNLMIKVLVVAALICAVLSLDQAHGNEKACVSISKFPMRSEVWQCGPGLSTVFLSDTMGVPVYTTVTTSVQTQAWLTKVGDVETAQTLRKKLGVPSILAPGAFMATYGTGLVYVLSREKFLLTVVWDAPHS